MMSVPNFSFMIILLYSSRLVTCRTIIKEAPIVQVKQGLLRGMVEKTLDGKEFYSYKSIPFAMPPVGPLRFKEPVAMHPWDEIFYATKDPDFCMQKMYTENITHKEPNVFFYTNEDCLRLNVFTPKKSSLTSRYPVMVYIHGGSFIIGGAQKMPPYLLMNEDIVLVVIQYRLGIFGFLSTDDSILPGNMGLKDQQFALKWVNENIESFGGNPNSITIFGDSAGSTSVNFQILIPSSRGLFHRAIMQSGTALAAFATSSKHREYATEAGEKFGCDLDNGTEQYLYCMQNIDASDLLHFANNKMLWDWLLVQTTPRVDGVFIPDHPELLMKEGKFNKVDLIVGSTKDEAVFIVQLLYEYPEFLQQINTKFDVYGPISLSLENEPNSPDLARKAYQHYLQKDSFITIDDDEKLLALFSNRLFESNLDTFIHFVLKLQDVSVYAYEFSYRGKYTSYNYIPALRNKNWAAHTDDNMYLFAGGPIMTQTFEEENDWKMQKLMVTAWTNFAKTGNPTPPGSNFIWEKITENNLMKLNITNDAKMIPLNLKIINEFWGSLDTYQNRLLKSEL